MQQNFGILLWTPINGIISMHRNVDANRESGLHREFGRNYLLPVRVYTRRAEFPRGLIDIDVCTLH